MTETLNTSVYPVLHPSEGLDYLNSLKEQWNPGNTPAMSVPRSQRPMAKAECPGTYDPQVVDDLRLELKTLAEQFPANISAVKGSRNDFDLEASKALYRHLKELPLAILLDKDFWRYLSVHVLFEVLIWRIPDSGKEAWPSNFGVGDNWSRCYPFKGFLRGQLIQKMIDEGMPWVDVHDVDFYDSHLFGRRNGMIPPVASALNSIRSDLTRSRDLDPFATTATRYRAVHVTELLEPDEAEALLRRYTAQSPSEE